MDKYYGIIVIVAMVIKTIIHRTLRAKAGITEISTFAFFLPYASPLPNNRKWLKLMCNLFWLVALLMVIVIIWDMTITAINGEPSKGRFGPTYRGDRGY